MDTERFSEHPSSYILSYIYGLMGLFLFVCSSTIGCQWRIEDSTYSYCCCCKCSSIILTLPLYFLLSHFISRMQW
jgi:hypothetical protein